jgi:ABC-type Na+ efflux pump permease subunit
MIPGLCGVILQVIVMLLTSYTIVREKEQKTLEQLVVTPVSRFGLMLGKLVPFWELGYLKRLLSFFNEIFIRSANYG